MTNDHCNRSSFPAIIKSFKFYFKTIQSTSQFINVLQNYNNTHKSIIKRFDKIHFFLGVKLCD